MKKMIIGVGIVSVFFLTGCSTNLTKISSSPKPASVRFGTFTNVEMLSAPIEPPFNNSGANKKAAKEPRRNKVPNFLI